MMFNYLLDIKIIALGMEQVFASIGKTRLVKLERVSREMHQPIYAKLELENPTHSHKDRESVAVIEDMNRKGITEVVIASTGNAAISLAALGKVSDKRVHIFYSEQVSEERKNLLQLLEAVLHPVKGGYEDAIKASKYFANVNGLYLANPGNSAKRKGDSEIGKEILRQIDCHDTTISVPTNNGTLLTGVSEGIGFEKGVSLVAAVITKTEIADSIAGFHKLEGKYLDKLIQQGKCKVVQVYDSDIKAAARSLALEGIFCEPASAASLAAIRKGIPVGHSTVLIITGSAFKFAKKDLGTIFND